MLALISDPQIGVKNNTYNVIFQTTEEANNHDMPCLALHQPWKKSHYENTQPPVFSRSKNWLVPGKNSLMKNLLSWLIHADDICAHVIFGDGDQEKIRLALELCEQAENLGWYAGLVTAPEVSRFINKQPSLQEWDWSQPTLVVADYADQRVEHLRKRFEELAKKSKSKVSLKLLLLESRRSHSTDWMISVF